MEGGEKRAREGGRKRKMREEEHNNHVRARVRTRLM